MGRRELRWWGRGGRDSIIVSPPVGNGVGGGNLREGVRTSSQVLVESALYVIINGEEEATHASPGDTSDVGSVILQTRQTH
jgi:hypothetical protein